MPQRNKILLHDMGEKSEEEGAFGKVESQFLCKTGLPVTFLGEGVNPILEFSRKLGGCIGRLAGSRFDDQLCFPSLESLLRAGPHKAKP